MKTPRPHQREAISKGVDYFAQHDRGKMIMPCGSGKTLTALWLAQALEAKRIIIVFPTLTLTSQTVNSWLEDFKATASRFSIFVLGSDKGIGKEHNVRQSTNVDEVEQFLEDHQEPTVFFSTYHSAKVLADAAQRTGKVFDLAIFDEAHHTAGADKALFQILLHDANLPIEKRLFMTATPKVVTNRSSIGRVSSMDDATTYGQEFYRLTVNQAIEEGIISDYRVLTLFSDNEEVAQWVRQNHFWKDEKERLDDEEFRHIAIAISLVKAIQKYKLKKVISFHSSVQRAKKFGKLVHSVSYLLNNPVEIFHLNGDDSENVRNRTIAEFKEVDLGLITNAKLLGEGFDMPAVDAVLFGDKRESATDIVQATGRAWRKEEGKAFGFILIPAIVSKDSVEMDSELISLRRVLAALVSSDERLLAYFRAKVGQKKSPNSQDIVIAEAATQVYDLDQLVHDIDIRVWANVKSLYYRSYEESKAWVQENLVPLGIDSSTAWHHYVLGKYEKAPQRPPDIRRRPQDDPDFPGWNDFLGTEKTGLSRKRKLFSYAEVKGWAQVHAVPQGVHNYTTWNKFLKSFTDLPKEIPRRIENQPDFISWEDFFGSIKETPKRGRSLKPFREQKEWVKLHLVPHGITTQWKWSKYLKGEYPDLPTLPDDFRRNPKKAPDFVSWDDFFAKG